MRKAIRVGMLLLGLCCLGLVPAVGANRNESAPEGVRAGKEKRTPVPFVTPRLADLAYGNGERQLLDVYPKKESDKAPIVVWLHSGGWKGGDKASPSIGGERHMC